MSENNLVNFVFLDSRIDTRRNPRDALSGFATAILTTNEIEMTSLKQVVEHVINSLRPNQKIGVLQIIDHGDAVGQEFGSDLITHMFLLGKGLGKLEWRQHLMRLKGKFGKDGYIHLAGCKVGQSVYTMMEISKLTGAPVFAGTGNTTASGHNTGSYVLVDAAKSKLSYRYETGSPSVEALNKGREMPMGSRVPTSDVFDRMRMRANVVKIVFKAIAGS
ncbi:DUF4347 domain-containing protein [Labrenzia sp. R4_1]|uniref:DUF4347 domain-containing protein n=1 Tax=Labrenzia sp. R4_1 TaxID=2821106 RepID=UPI001ADAA3A5|nr:DUF4347 domain-containing protein [Labrenzia sp. R4_1]MBO9423904.1 DUF4347 domain-containing protein [Labrenzia sp. R4_1]